MNKHPNACVCPECEPAPNPEPFGDMGDGLAPEPTRPAHTPGPWEWISAADAPSTHRELVRAPHEPGAYDSILYHGADWPMLDEDAARIVDGDAALTALAAAGIHNPEALTGLLGAADKLEVYSRDLCYDKGLGTESAALRAALAAVREVGP